MLSRKILAFCTVGRAKSKTAFFRVFRVPFKFNCPAHSLQETVLPQINCTDGKRRPEGVPFASLESLSCLVLHNHQQTSWSITLMVVVGYGMRHLTGAELAN